MPVPAVLRRPGVGRGGAIDRGLAERLHVEFVRSRRTTCAVAVVVIGLAPQTTRRRARALARVAEAGLRRYDHVSVLRRRAGLVAVVTDTTAEGAAAAADRLRTATGLPVGLACFPHDGQQADVLLAAAIAAARRGWTPAVPAARPTQGERDLRGEVGGAGRDVIGPPCAPLRSVGGVTTNGAPGRVLLVDLAAGHGGAEKRVVQLATGLRARGVDAVVACLHDGSLAAELAATGLPHALVRCGRGDPRTVLSLIGHVRRARADVVDAHNVQSQFWSLPAAALLRVRHVATVHSEYRTSEGGGGLRGRAYHAVLGLARRSGSRFISVSDSVTAYLQTVGADQQLTSTVWSAVDVPAPRDPAARAAVRARLGLAEQDFVVASVGRLVPAKDQQTLLRAVAVAARSVPGLRLLLVGDGPEEARLREQADVLDLGACVHFLGHRSDVPDLLAASDVFVLTSLTEGLPYVLLEAAAAGTPIIATAVGGIPTVFTDGVDATLVEPGQVREIAAAIVAAATRPIALADQAQGATRLLAERGGTARMVDLTLTAYGLTGTPSGQLAGGERRRATRPI